MLRQDVLAASAASPPPRFVGAAESAFHWERIVANEAGQALPLIDPTGLAALAVAAWDLVHAWGAGGESWRAWSGGDDDPAAFGRWADRYANILARENAIDIARLPDALARVALNIATWRGATVWLAGFVELTPQQQRLLAALAAAGMHIDHCALPANRHAGAYRVSAPDPRAEVGTALAWARAHRLAHPDACIGIAIADFAARRSEVRALAEDILCPALQWPGREDDPRPYEMSLGEPLSEVPLVTAALAVLALLEGPQPCGEVAAWLRSPYLAGAPHAWLERAAIERDWIEEGRARVALADTLESLNHRDALLAGRLREARRRVALPGRATPRKWVEIWRDWLAATGWPGERVLASAEFQARGKFDEALAAFASIATAELPHAEAASALRSHIRCDVFQPEGTEAPIRILGLLEAAGLEFDALWVAGLGAESWPRSARPNPFIPIAWQVERGVPHANAARDLAFAQALTDQLASAAPIVITSHALQLDDHPSAPSALIERLPAWTGVLPEVAGTIAQVFAARPPLETVVDERAPPHIVTGGTRGGAGLIEAQSDCPFKAQATYRLHADPWPVAAVGLTAAERGTLVHATLAEFWRAIGDHGSFVALAPEALAAQVERAAGLALANPGTIRSRLLPPTVAAGEQARLARVAQAWLEAVERDRPAFHVRGTEISMPLRLGELELTVRLDRWDELEEGGCAIIDYKTGAMVAVKRWFARRPEAPQLGLYALALRSREPELPVRAVAYAYVRPGECGARGIAAQSSAWPALTRPEGLAKVGIATWSDVELFWSANLRALADEFVAGYAQVDPRKPSVTCRACRRMALCRIDLAALADDLDEPEGGDD